MNKIFKKSISALLISLILSLSYYTLAFNGKMPLEVSEAIKGYVNNCNNKDEYSDLEKGGFFGFESINSELERNFANIVWNKYVLKFTRIQKKLNAIYKVLDGIYNLRSEINDPHQKLRTTLILDYLKYICNPNNIKERFFNDLCPPPHTYRFSFGTLVQYSSKKNISYDMDLVCYLLSYARTGYYCKNAVYYNEVTDRGQGRLFAKLHEDGVNYLLNGLQ